MDRLTRGEKSAELQRDAFCSHQDDIGRVYRTYIFGGPRLVLFMKLTYSGVFADLNLAQVD